MDSTILQEKVRAIEKAARNLGFDGFGITRPKIPQAVERYQRWLALQYEGEMGYMSRWAEKRADLDKVLPGVQSVICLRTNYFPKEKDLTFLDDTDQGDISLYALNDDYHDILTPRLKQLEEKIHQGFNDCQTKVYVDTGPVLEKPLAEQAGIGWVGKHTNLISEGVGSWYFLSEILTDIPLPESQKAVNRCGTCRDCIDICPTQAIIAPYVLDSRRCISYLTIELKGVIPVRYRKAIGNRIYGCDDCQIVCPWNSYAVKTDEEAFHEREGVRRLIDLMRLDDEGFSRRFRKSPVKRIKRRGLLRNVAVALGNSGNLDAVSPLIEVLNDKEPLIRAHAVWALGELLQEKAPTVLWENLREETDEMVLTEIRNVDKTFRRTSGSYFSSE
ncbi:MAG: tRNA epoxyqueuosine(34) reductase QueG [Nitrospinae bacterium]|jgi:epoxyqueuosine reductase|nr:tRNA epoxyqueuosine(34) reductase QueG [Nitrospinota bacterium]MDA1110104.1 tRNA epoxyqueuosine(34) reductase QueG [Nitrospinota bacterium]